MRIYRVRNGYGDVLLEVAFGNANRNGACKVGGNCGRMLTMVMAAMVMLVDMMMAMVMATMMARA